MSSYCILASLYDALTENVDYQARSNYISGFFKTENINNGTIVDLACGTGSFSKCFADMGFEVIGVDLSEEMLTMAQSKLSAYNNISFINMDIREFSPDINVDCVICCLDSINHLCKKEDVFKVFSKVHSYLRKDGLFIFDVNTIYKHKHILANNTFVFDEDGYFLVWDNELITNDTVRIILDFFFEKGDVYERFTEDFCEKAYSVDELCQMLKSAGFKSVTAYNELEFSPPVDSSERIYFVCKK